MILDDGGDATLYIILGAKAENGEQVLPNPANEEEEALKHKFYPDLKVLQDGSLKLKIV